MRGGLHAGAYKALKERYGKLEFLNGIYGCSVGCLFALATSYDLSVEQMERIYNKYFRLDSILEKLSLDHLSSLLERKGMITTDHFIRKVIEAFLAEGIDLRNMVMDDLPQKTYFLSSNLTTGRSSLLTGDVPVLKAIACSVCIPMVFVPEILNNHVHVDGGVYTKCIREVVPEDTLVIHISRTDSCVTPNSESLFDIIMSIVIGKRETYSGKNVLRIENRSVRSFDDVTDQQRKQMAEEGYSQTRAFLAKRFPEEVK